MARTWMKFGPHKYPDSGIGSCEHKCGCRMGSADSDGPPGIDRWDGPCPGDPLEGEPKADDRIRYGEYITTQNYFECIGGSTIQMRQKLYEQEHELKRLRADNALGVTGLRKELNKAKAALATCHRAIRLIKENVRAIRPTKNK